MIGISLAPAVLTTFTSSAAIAQQSPAPLGNTAWRLVEIRSWDDAQEPRRPAAPPRYTRRLQDDGRAVLQPDCNQATGGCTLEEYRSTAGGYALVSDGMVLMPAD